MAGRLVCCAHLRVRSRSAPAARSAVLAALVLSALTGAPPALAAPDHGASISWTVPVGGPVVATFRAPPGPYAAGHRGIDYAVRADDPVVAAGAGIVTFSGTVGDAQHVVVAHDRGLRTTYSFVTGIAVTAGQRVARGALLARAAAIAPVGHPAGVFHFGLRAGDRYLDPTLLFRPIDLAEAVHLVPVDRTDPMTGSEHDRSLLAEAGRTAGRFAGHVPGWVASTGAEAAAAATDALHGGAQFGAGLARFAHDVGARGVAGAVVPTWQRFWADAGPAVRVAWMLKSNAIPIAGRYLTPLLVARQVLDGFGDYLARWGDCTRTDLVPEAHPRGNGHLVVAVGGLGSSDDDRAINALPLDQLGYEPGDVIHYSYRDDGPAYAAADTFGDIEQDARRLAGQLRQIAREHPGREVDLVGHSLGGVVVRAFLALYYDASDPTFPPLGPAVALAAPLKGIVIASAAANAAQSITGRAVEAVVHGVAPSLPPPGAIVTAQLAEGSDFMHRLEAAPLPAGQLFVSVTGANDVIVPGDRTRLRDASNVTVSVPGWDHPAIVRAPETVATLQLVLAGRRAPCPTLARAVRARVEPYAIDQIEHFATDGLAVALHETDRELSGGQPAPARRRRDGQEPRRVP